MIVKRVNVVAADARAMADLDPAFTLLIAAGVQALIVTQDAALFGERQRIAQLAAAARLPTVAGIREHAVFLGPHRLADYDAAGSLVDHQRKAA